jgi:hypothetical protein
MKKIFCVVALMALLACSSEKTSTVNTQGQGSAAPDKGDMPAAIATSTQDKTGASSHFSIELIPAEATKNSMLNLIVHGAEPANTRVIWLVNGSPVANNSSTQFNPANIKKGDVVQAKAIDQGKEVLSNIVPIKNSPPELSNAKFTMNDPSSPGKLSVAVSGRDADGDEVTYLYEWTKNGEPAGKDKTIASSIKRGDQISVKITPFDGEAYGRPAILNMEVKNLPPVFAQEESKLSFKGHVCTTQIRATDPDGDTLTYSLKEAPPGMTIDPATGVMTWNVPPDFEGKVSFTACVNDGHGGETLKTFHFEVTPETKK